MFDFKLNSSRFVCIVSAKYSNYFILCHMWHPITSLGFSESILSYSFPKKFTDNMNCALLFHFGASCMQVHFKCWKYFCNWYFLAYKSAPVVSRQPSAILHPSVGSDSSIHLHFQIILCILNPASSLSLDPVSLTLNWKDLFLGYFVLLLVCLCPIAPRSITSNIDNHNAPLLYLLLHLQSLLTQTARSRGILITRR